MKKFERFMEALVSDPASGVVWEGEFEGAAYKLCYDRGFVRGHWGGQVCQPPPGAPLDHRPLGPDLGRLGAE